MEHTPTDDRCATLLPRGLYQGEDPIGQLCAFLVEHGVCWMHITVTQPIALNQMFICHQGSQKPWFYKDTCVQVSMFHARGVDICGFGKLLYLPCWGGGHCLSEQQMFSKGLICNCVRAEKLSNIGLANTHSHTRQNEDRLPLLILFVIVH